MCHFEVGEGQPTHLSKEAELAVYRIAQEALTNARRHSNAANVTLSITQSASGLRLVISDDGEGFQTKPLGELAREGKFGLIGLVERARLAGGNARIDSELGRGTRISLEVPAGVH